jgi:hypothetical protein
VTHIAHLDAEMVDGADQLDVVIHDVYVVFLVNLSLFLQSFLKCIDTVLQECLLVFIFYLDVWVGL